MSGARRQFRAGRARRGLTLVETVAAIVVLGIVAGVVAPVINGTADAFAAATRGRSAVESAAYAMERCVRLLRDAPATSDGASLAIASASASSIRFTDGRGVELSSGTLWLVEGGVSYPLCRGVTGFTILYRGADATTDTQATPAGTHRFHVTLAAQGTELRCTAFPRVRFLSAP